MSQLKIMPAEVYVTEFGALIRTRCPKEHVTEAMIHERVVAANLAAGDTVRVQCLTHDKSVVLHTAEFLVYDRRSELKRVEVNDRESRQFEHVAFSICPTQPWAATPAGREIEDAVAAAEAAMKKPAGKAAA